MGFASILRQNLWSSQHHLDLNNMTIFLCRQTAGFYIAKHKHAHTVLDAPLPYQFCHTQLSSNTPVSEPSCLCLCQCKISKDLFLKNNTSKGYSLVIGLFYISINNSRLEDLTLLKIISLLFLLLNAVTWRTAHATNLSQKQFIPS